MPDLTPAQQAAADAKAARLKEKADLKVKRDAFRRNIGKTFSDGERDAYVVGVEENHFSSIDRERGDCFLVHFGNANCIAFRLCDKFLAEFQLKGAQ